MALLEALPLAVLVTDGDGKITYANAACAKLFVTTSDALCGSEWIRFIDERDHENLPVQTSKSLEYDQAKEFEVRLVLATGQRIRARYTIAPSGISAENGSYVHVVEDIDRIRPAQPEESQSEDELAVSRERARLTLEAIDDAVISTDVEGYIVDINAAAETLTGWNRLEATGRPLTRVFNVINSDSRTLVHTPIETRGNTRGVNQTNEKGFLFRSDGSDIAIEYSSAPLLNKEKPVGTAVVFRDHTRFQQKSHKMARMAHHDFLTGLPNRTAIAEHFDQFIKFDRRHRRRVGLLFIDLNNFDRVNEDLGHHSGDRLLKSCSKLLTECVRGTDLVGRYGGDQFVVLLDDINEPGDAERAAVKILREAARFSETELCPIKLELSIGISLYPGDGHDLPGLIERADAAMNRARTNDKQYCFYEKGMELRQLDHQAGNPLKA